MDFKEELKTTAQLITSRAVHFLIFLLTNNYATNVLMIMFVIAFMLMIISGN